jgi:fumarate hydratase, class II
MADMCDHLRRYMIEGAKRAEPKLTENIERSVMIVTALSPIIGYDNASVISHYAIDHNLTLKQAALDQGSAKSSTTGGQPARGDREGSADLAPVAKHG